MMIFKYQQNGHNSVDFRGTYTLASTKNLAAITVTTREEIFGELSGEINHGKNTFNLRDIHCFPSGNSHGSLLLKTGIDLIKKVPYFLGTRKIIACTVTDEAIAFYQKSGFHISLRNSADFHEDINEDINAGLELRSNFLDTHLRWSRAIEPLGPYSRAWNWEGDIDIIHSICTQRISRLGWREC
ncbi:MAG: hypothetical protein PUP46_03810 [Endozoicomonas sp. (ex Botrylloides leachii)]|nr:hypothetical protein [Endozoicomonas sp. (ex Botrylloides leachii)]